ncbi:histidine kinase [Actinoplanes sp. NPDC051470]|uniref:sensor histidine kinase n=1 Tax=Actinoplanes sp. NPDC051470 TaxID=3157224 RepID=UPI003414CB58
MPAVRTENRWLLPSALVAELEPSRPARRSTRDWIIDTLCFLIGFGFTVLVTADLLSDNVSIAPEWANTPPWLAWLDFVVATIASVGLWWRRRWPVQLFLAMLVLGLFTVAGGITGAIMLFTVAVHRKFSTTALLATGFMLVTLVFVKLRPEAGRPYWETVAWSAVFTLIIVLWGAVVRSRRQLLISLRDRAERAESEQQLRVAQARALERTRIAREMHDVLAHRISLVSLHAGALEIRGDASPDEVATAAGVIRASAHQALQDLREVIGVLRADGDVSSPPEPPQPTIAELTALADESRAAGARVRLELDVAAEAVPEGAGRTAYRIVQEGLTNARKHAPGATVTVAIAGGPGNGLTVTVRNPWPAGHSPTVIPGAGTGLVGLAERATLAGGRLTHGREPGGDFVLTAWLPWPRPATEVAA